jgi:predicted AAA+ superfamily ATPase
MKPAKTLQSAVRPHVDHQVVGAAGEFLTAGKLFKRGYQVSVTYGNAKAIDLFVHNPHTGRTFQVQVKAQQRKNCFPLRREAIDRNAIFVFVRLNGPDDAEEFFVVPGDTILADIPGYFGSSYRDPKHPSSFPGVNYGSLEPHRNGWSVFDAP